MPDLFTPFETNGLHLKNRIVMPPMANNLCGEDGAVTGALRDHYARRAEKEVALLIVEHSYVLPSGRAHRKQLGIHDDAMVPGLSTLAQTVHALGARVGIQITHAGSNTGPDILGEAPLAPSAVPHPVREGAATPRELTAAGLAAVREAFAAAARRALEAGFDVVEVHGAHGYLLNQFFSPLTNRRDDEYGGSLENRLRFPCEVIAAVRAALGRDCCLFYRFGADDQLPGGVTVAEAQKAAPLLKEAGVDVLDLSGGLCGAARKTGEGFFLYLAEALKPAAGMPVMVTGGLGDPRLADRVIREGTADLVGVGRALLADPDWAVKAATVLGR